MAAFTTQSRHLMNPLTAVLGFDRLGIHPHFHLLADQLRVDRVEIAAHADRRVARDARPVVVRLLDIAVLMRPPRMIRCRQTVMRHQDFVSGGERFSLREVVNRCRKRIGSMLHGDDAQLPQRIL